ncbi:hypothetical protein CPB83DRAFT_900135 [Crepidotus variabilis]|uniref:Uncharacterized protein n=1 Tax=Crepidotus variabilis TaxID=179855 RepID=A0A9P6E3R9_9AGAR|nr:hypothetical protein CPB83DRAFT_900135 [Crepidotus variabilis]
MSDLIQTAEAEKQGACEAATLIEEMAQEAIELRCSLQLLIGLYEENITRLQGPFATDEDHAYRSVILHAQNETCTRLDDLVDRLDNGGKRVVDTSSDEDVTQTSPLKVAALEPDPEEEPTKSQTRALGLVARNARFRPKRTRTEGLRSPISLQTSVSKPVSAVVVRIDGQVYGFLYLCAYVEIIDSRRYAQPSHGRSVDVDCPITTQVSNVDSLFETRLAKLTSTVYPMAFKLDRSLYVYMTEYFRELTPMRSLDGVEPNTVGDIDTDKEAPIILDRSLTVLEDVASLLLGRDEDLVPERLSVRLIDICNSTQSNVNYSITTRSVTRAVVNSATTNTTQIAPVTPKNKNVKAVQSSVTVMRDTPIGRRNDKGKARVIDSDCVATTSASCDESLTHITPLPDGSNDSFVFEDPYECGTHALWASVDAAALEKPAPFSKLVDIPAGRLHYEGKARIIDSDCVAATSASCDESSAHITSLPDGSDDSFVFEDPYECGTQTLWASVDAAVQEALEKPAPSSKLVDIPAGRPHYEGKARIIDSDCVAATSASCDESSAHITSLPHGSDDSFVFEYPYECGTQTLWASMDAAVQEALEKPAPSSKLVGMDEFDLLENEFAFDSPDIMKVLDLSEREALSRLVRYGDNQYFNLPFLENDSGSSLRFIAIHMKITVEKGTFGRELEYRCDRQSVDAIVGRMLEFLPTILMHEGTELHPALKPTTLLDGDVMERLADLGIGPTTGGMASGPAIGSPTPEYMNLEHFLDPRRCKTRIGVFDCIAPKHIFNDVDIEILDDSLRFREEMRKLCKANRLIFKTEQSRKTDYYRNGIQIYDANYYEFATSACDGRCTLFKPIIGNMWFVVISPPPVASFASRGELHQWFQKMTPPLDAADPEYIEFMTYPRKIVEIHPGETIIFPPGYRYEFFTTEQTVVNRVLYYSAHCLHLTEVARRFDALHPAAPYPFFASERLAYEDLCYMLLRFFNSTPQDNDQASRLSLNHRRSIMALISMVITPIQYINESYPKYNNIRDRNILLEGFIFAKTPAIRKVFSGITNLYYPETQGVEFRWIAGDRFCIVPDKNILDREDEVGVELARVTELLLGRSCQHGADYLFESGELWCRAAGGLDEMDEFAPEIYSNLLCKWAYGWSDFRLQVTLAVSNRYFEQ